MVYDHIVFVHVLVIVERVWSLTFWRGPRRQYFRCSKDYHFWFTDLLEIEVNVKVTLKHMFQEGLGGNAHVSVLLYGLIKWFVYIVCVYDLGGR